MHFTIFDTPVVNSLIRVISIVLLKLFGWRKAGQIPDIPKFVMIAAPHTSNWDLLVTLGLAFSFRLKIYWMGKESLFKAPFGGLMKWLGGIPIDRSKSNDVVAQSIEIFNNSEKLVMLVPPEGTRAKVMTWKTGFYYIADGANVPIVLGFVDYGRKAGGFGPVLMPTGDIENDMKKIHDFYLTVTAKYPEKSSLARLKAIKAQKYGGIKSL